MNEGRKNTSVNLKRFWREDGYDLIADLGEMKQAIVVVYATPPNDSYYCISSRSFFPFTDEQHKTHFKDPEKCCLFAESIILRWIQSLLTDFKFTIDNQPAWLNVGDRNTHPLISDSHGATYQLDAGNDGKEENEGQMEY